MNDDLLERHSATPDGKPLEEQPAWRTSFPIDVAQDHYLARREFTKFLSITSLGLAIGQCWIVFQNWMEARNQTPHPRQPIAKVDEVPVGGFKMFAYPAEEESCLLLHLEPGKFVAYDQKCTHLSCAVIPDPSKSCLRCPCHNGSFDPSTGRPLAGPPRRPLPRISLEVVDGTIFATDVEHRTV